MKKIVKVTNNDNDRPSYTDFYYREFEQRDPKLLSSLRALVDEFKNALYFHTRWISR